jgi:ribonucleoside-diphosphate reductase alpha chain
MPKETTEDEIWNIYFYGWEKKLKGMTVYRSGSRDTEVLELKKKEPVPAIVPLPTNGRILPKRPRDLPATNSKRRSGCGKLIISVAEYNGRPYETIIKNKGGCDAMNDAIGQLISLAMRWNVPTWDIIKTLKNVTCPVAYKKFSKGEADGKSCADIVGRVIEELVPDDINENKQYNFEATTDNYIMDKDKEDNREVCPDCGEPLNMIEGCRSCACGYSKCG